MLNLKEVKVSKYGGKCAKCERELKVGWSIFFNPDTKDIYCKPCGTQLQKLGPEISKSEASISDAQFDILLDILSKHGDQLAAINSQVNTMSADLLNVLIALKAI